MNGSVDDIPVQWVRVLQIIAGALLAGLVSFLCVVLVIAHDRPPNESMIISLLAVAVLALNVVMSMVVPMMLTQNSLRQIASGTWRPPQTEPGSPPAEYGTDVDKLRGVRQATLIVTLALLEGAGFFGCIAYLLEGQLFTLGVVGVAILFMASNFPTLANVRTWLDRYLAVLADLRQNPGQELPPR